jgi:UDP-N-acetylmuramoylalanine-D-glutamate ligase
MDPSELAGKRVLVVGLARAGSAAADALLAAGADVVAFSLDETGRPTPEGSGRAASKSTWDARRRR